MGPSVRTLTAVSALPAAAAAAIAVATLSSSSSSSTKTSLPRFAPLRSTSALRFFEPVKDSGPRLKASLYMDSTATYQKPLGAAILPELMALRDLHIRGGDIKVSRSIE